MTACRRVPGMRSERWAPPPQDLRLDMHVMLRTREFGVASTHVRGVNLDAEAEAIEKFVRPRKRLTQVTRGILRDVKEGRTEGRHG